MKQILKGYVSLFREVLGRPNDGAFLTPPASIGWAIAICGLIGLIRNSAIASFDVDQYFFSYHPDILWTMFSFPVHLFLLPGALLHWQLRLLGYKHVSAEEIFGLSFHLQLLHLLIPILEVLGLLLNLPWSYVIGERVIRTDWFTNVLFMTPGILGAWWITAYVVARVLVRRLQVSWPAVVLVSITSFLVILVPTYFTFPALNTIFNRLVGLWFWYPQDYPNNRPSYYLYWGYGTYFALTALVGLAYYLKHRGKGKT